jgi:hypothetical protein
VISDDDGSDTAASKITELLIVDRGTMNSGADDAQPVPISVMLNWKGKR